MLRGWACCSIAIAVTIFVRLLPSGGDGGTHVNTVNGIAVPNTSQPVLGFIFRLDDTSVDEFKEARPVVAIVFTETFQEPIGLS